jgi:pyruvate/2-oxoglutarate/acetoin dehydrogenase E1 component
MKEMFFSEAISAAIRNEMLRDENVYLLGEDVGVYGGSFGATAGLYDEFGPERIKDTPISEIAIVGTSAGAAVTGMRPIAELMFNDFMGCCMDQILNQAAKFRYMYGGRVKVPMVIRLACGGYVTGAAQHSQSLEAMLVHIPGLKVVYPSNPQDAIGLIISAIRDDNPVVVFEHQMLYGVKGEVDENFEPIPLGKGKIKREGTDVTLIATGLQVTKAMEAAAELEKDGISVEVIDPRSLYPLDKELIYNSVEKTGRVVIVTEECKRGAWSGELASRIAEDRFDALKKKIVRVGALDTPVPFTLPLETYVLPQVEYIVAAVKTII